MIYNIPREYDIVITYTWAQVNHGKVSGHIFEVIDYYLLLRKFYKVCIFIGDGKTYEDIMTLVRDKYKDIDEMKDIFFYNNPKILNAKDQTVIITDGAAPYIFNRGGYIYYSNLILFRCGKVPSLKPLESKPNVYILQDSRIYKPDPKLNCIDYTKKILFDQLKDKTEEGDSAFLYLTSNCRKYNIEEVKDYYSFNKYLVCRDKAIPDLINKINAYIYTPVFCEGSGLSIDKYKFDCSPRLIAECKYYNIPVYYYNIDYEDKGLEARRFDIENNFQSLHLNSSDYIFNLLEEIL